MPGRALPDLTATTTLDEAGLLYVTTAAGVSRKITVANFRTALALAARAHYYMSDNATGTTLTDQSTFYKIAGTTSSGSAVAGFTQTDNRATLTDPVGGLFQVSVTAAVTDGNNQTIALRLAKNGTTIASSQGRATTSSGGRADVIVCQDLVTLATGDYLEVWAANMTSAGATMTAVDLTLIASRVY